MAKTSDKVKKIVKGKAKAEAPKELDYLSYQEQEELTDETALSALNHIRNVYGLKELAATRAGLLDLGVVEQMVEPYTDLFKIDKVDGADGPLGAFHASIKEIAVARSNTERKGMRATLIVRVERYYNDGADAGKEVHDEYRDVCPCDCVSELIRDIIHEVCEVLVSQYNKVVTDYNNKLEKKDNCGCKGCNCRK